MYKSWDHFQLIVNQELEKLKNDSIIIEIGGGANPCLSQEQVKIHQYIVIDIDELELKKSKGEHFQKICADITAERLNFKCDLIITNMCF